VQIGLHRTEFATVLRLPLQIWFQGLNHLVSRANGAKPAAYVTSARNLIPSQQAVKLKMNAVLP